MEDIIFEEIKKDINYLRSLLRNQNKTLFSKKLGKIENILKRNYHPHLDCELKLLKGELEYFNLNIGTALDLYFSALELSKKNDLINFSALALNHLGVCYATLGLPDKAIKYYEESLEFADNYFVMCNLAERYIDNHNIDDALKLYNRIFTETSPDKKPTLYASAYISLADYYLDCDDDEKAKKYYLDGLDLCEKSNNFRKMNFAYIGLGRYYLKKKQLDKSFEFFDKAIKQAKKLNMKELLWFSFNAITEYYEEVEDYKNLYKYFKMKTELNEKIFNSSIEQKIAGLEIAYSLENKKLETEKMIEKSSKLVSIGVMAAGITHEINQPLNSIAVNADGMLFTNEHENILTPFYIDAIKQIYDSAIRISEIIKHMRQFWSPNDYLQKTEFDVNSSIINALKLINKKLDAHNINLKKNLCRNKTIIIGNKVHLEQIIINLIVNAIQALDESEKKNKFISIKTSIDKNIHIEISDNGIGIPHNMNEEIFSPFYSSKGNESNMGLGLSIVQQFVISMKGKISCNNNDLGGATFKITLPLKNEGMKDENIIG